MSNNNIIKHKREEKAKSINHRKNLKNKEKKIKNFVAPKFFNK